MDFQKIAFLCLTAHYLELDTNIIHQRSTQKVGFETSISTIDISESRSIPEWIQKNPTYMELSKTKYGLRYISYIESRKTPVVFFEGHNDDF